MHCQLCCEGPICDHLEGRQAHRPGGRLALGMRRAKHVTMPAQSGCLGAQNHSKAMPYAMCTCHPARAIAGGGGGGAGGWRPGDGIRPARLFLPPHMRACNAALCEAASSRRLRPDDPKRPQRARGAATWRPVLHMQVSHSLLRFRRPLVVVTWFSTVIMGPPGLLCILLCPRTRAFQVSFRHTFLPVAPAPPRSALVALAGRVPACDRATDIVAGLVPAKAARDGEEAVAADEADLRLGAA